MQFSSYESIENLNEKLIKSFVNGGKGDAEWVAMEKIHGSNLSFITNGKNIRVAKRGGILGEVENFFNAQELVKKYKNDLLEIFVRVQKLISKVTQVQIYGEMYGGYYPGQESKVKPVQRGISYRPEIDFISFDIKVTSPDESVYLSNKEFETVFVGLKIDYVPVLARGKLSDLIKLSPVFPSTIPALFRLPDVADNMAEGYVFKLNKRVNATEERPIVKSKNGKFDEVAASSMVAKLTTPTSYNSEFEPEILKYCTQNRFNNVLSKHGPETKEESLVGLFIQDMVTDFIKEVPKEKMQEFRKNTRKLREHLAGHIKEHQLVSTWLAEYHNGKEEL